MVSGEYWRIIIRGLPTMIDTCNICQLRKVQRGNQNQQIEGQTIQWPKEKDKRTTNALQNITHKAKDRVTRTPLKTWGEHRCSGRVSSSSSTSGTRRVNQI
jgi:hypothetical protein